jgi:hypothetical protein
MVAILPLQVFFYCGNVTMVALPQYRKIKAPSIEFLDVRTAIQKMSAAERIKSKAGTSTTTKSTLSPLYYSYIRYPIGGTAIRGCSEGYHGGMDRMTLQNTRFDYQAEEFKPRQSLGPRQV